uniref:Uncharacterized protein n=1 Tax=Lotharella oceanica TaxID=641309 RepID=A0A7S2U2J1_9EUKA
MRESLLDEWGRLGVKLADPCESSSSDSEDEILLDCIRRKRARVDNDKRSSRDSRGSSPGCTGGDPLPSSDATPDLPPRPRGGEDAPVSPSATKHVPRKNNASSTLKSNATSMHRSPKVTAASSARRKESSSRSTARRPAALSSPTSSSSSSLSALGIPRRIPKKKIPRKTGTKRMRVTSSSPTVVAASSSPRLKSPSRREQQSGYHAREKLGGRYGHSPSVTSRRVDLFNAAKVSTSAAAAPRRRSGESKRSKERPLAKPEDEKTRRFQTNPPPRKNEPAASGRHVAAASERPMKSPPVWVHRRFCRQGTLPTHGDDTPPRDPRQSIPETDWEMQLRVGTGRLASRWSCKVCRKWEGEMAYCFVCGSREHDTPASVQIGGMVKAMSLGGCRFITALEFECGLCPSPQRQRLDTEDKVLQHFAKHFDQELKHFRISPGSGEKFVECLVCNKTMQVRQALQHLRGSRHRRRVSSSR